MRMSRGPDETAYDLSNARAITERLRRGPSATPVEAPSSQVPYARFPKTRPGIGAPSADETELAEDVPWSTAMMGSGGWTKLLEWYVTSLNAHGALIVDSSGLVIASTGSLATEIVEETGARVSVAFEQGDQMLRTLGSLRTLTLELDRGWLVGIRIHTIEGLSLIIGVVSPRRISASAQQSIADAFSKKARGV